MSKYIVDSSLMTGIADNIRLKTGEEGNLVFPTGFNVAIESLPSIEDMRNIKDKVDDIKDIFDSNESEIDKTITDTASIVSLSDGADNQPMALKVAVEPVQDLHGYDNPWPAGGGKNKLPFPYANGTGEINGVMFTVNNDGSIKINGTATADVYFRISDDRYGIYNLFKLASGNYTLSDGFASRTSNKFTFVTVVKNGTVIESDIASTNSEAGADGPNFTIANDLDYTNFRIGIKINNGTTVANETIHPMIRLASVSDATFAPYSNICPISGWTGAKVANISDSEKQPYFAGLLNGTYGFVDLGTLDWAYSSDKSMFYANIPGMSGDSTVKVRCGKYYNGTINFTWSTASSCVDKSVNTGNNHFIYVKDSAYTDAATFKTAMSGVYLVYELATPATPTITQAQYNTLLQSFNLGGWLVPISWQSEAGTVYGGTLTVNKDGTGSLVVDHGITTIADLQFSGNISAYIYAPINGKKIGITNLISSHFKTVDVSATEMQNGSIKGSTLNTNIFIKINGYNSITDFVNAEGTAQICYEIDPYVTYALTAPQVKTLIGLNNIWADTGKINEVEYSADSQLCITNKLNELDSLLSTYTETQE